MKEYGGTFTQERYIEEELVRYEYRIEYSSNGTDWAPYEETQNTVFRTSSSLAAQGRVISA